MSPALSSPSDRRAVSRGFTLVEILTVIAVIGILATILFPLVGKAQENARKAKTRVQFSQWGSAIEAFRQEYGFYPQFVVGDAAISGDKIDSDTDTAIFVETLSGRTTAGVVIDDENLGFVAGNTKKIPFYSFGANDLTTDASPLLQDAFGNTEIVVLLDNNYDGLVKVGTGGDYGSVPGVGTLSAPLATDQFVRAGVIFYSAGAGNTDGDVVTSWK